MKRTSLMFLGVCTLLSLAPISAWAAGGPEVGPNTQVNAPQQLFPNDLMSRNSPTLAASEDGQNLLAGWDDFQGFCGAPTNRPCPPQNPPGLSGFGFSTDGGATWTDGGAPYPIGSAYTAGHPWVARGGEAGDEVFYFTSRMRVFNFGSAGIGIHRGRFGAGTFAWDDARIINSPNPNDYYSRPAAAAAGDSAYVALVNAIEACGFPSAGAGQIEVWRTHDAGDTWQGPVVVSEDLLDPNDPADPLCGFSGTLQTAVEPAVGPAGEVYLAWQFGPFVPPTGDVENTSAIAFSRSLDGGVTFDPRKILVQTNNMRDNAPVGYAKNRMNDQPRIAVATTGPHRGRVYVAFYQSVVPVSSPLTAQTDVSSQVYLMHSDDRGETWSTPVEIAGPVPPTGVKRFWPTVAVRPGGDVDVIYMESLETQVTPDPNDVECSVRINFRLRREGPLSSLVDTYWVQSRDGGASFGAPVRVSSETSNWCEPAYLPQGNLYSSHGDYLGIATSGNRTFALWPDNRNGVVDVFFADIFGKVDK